MSVVYFICAVGSANTQTKRQSAWPEAAPVHDKQIWNLQNADINSVINTVSKETGKNFVVDPRVTGRVSLISSVPLDSNALYHVFLSVLDVYGYSAVESGEVVKIVPNTQATQSDLHVASNAAPGSGDEMVVRVVPVHFVSALQVMAILRPLAPTWSHISAYGPTNILILSGHANSINHLLEIISDIDKDSTSDVDIVPLKTASAAQLALLFKSLDAGVVGQNTRNKALVIADEKNNRLLVSGGKLARLRARALIADLDIKGDKKTSSTEVIYLHYLKAKDFASVLAKTAKGELHMAQTSGSKNRDDVDVQAEEGSNAIIVSAPPAIMKNLKDIVTRLDVRPSQVLVQAIIVELSATETEKLGIQWGMVDQAGDNVDSAFRSGLGLGVIKAGNFRALVSAISGISNADVLSQPTIVVLDNKEAAFSVGKEVSIIKDSTGLGTTDSSTGLPLTTAKYDRQNVGLELDVTPQIGQGDAVQLGIKQKNGTLQNPDNPGDKPVINNSAINTSVIVNSGDILVLGGLMSNSLTDSLSKTPVLGDIPVLGKLFHHKSHSLDKKNLLVFIHPVILKTPTDGTRISEAKYDSMRHTQDSWQAEWLSGKDDPAERRLPPREQLLKLPPPF